MISTSKSLTDNLGQAAKTVPLVVAGAALMTLAAKVQIPFWPVPMTLHTLAVMGFAACLGPRVATSIFLTYLALGAAGYPVFSGTPERGIGLAYMVGPTGGYLAGFLIASWLVGTLSAGRGFFGTLASMLVGLGLTYAMGVAWLAIFVPFDKLLAYGFTPFILGDFVKIGIAAAACTLIANWRKSRRTVAQ
ncbi:biotin transporter BioY [Roseibium sp. SCP14]|uniref:biotin transporter BioY n=1 Tax=Roseibium sp. SCP14 TaxID=3141375 RepID=UPI00333B9560